MKNKTKLLNLVIAIIFSFISSFVFSQISNNSISANTAICSGTVPSSSLAGSTPTISNCNPGFIHYQWQKSINNINFSDLLYDTLKNYSISTALSQTTYYRRIVTHGTCTNSSNTVTITVYPISVGGNISGNSNICIGSSTGTLTLSGYTGSILNWQKRLNNGSWTTINNTTSTHSEILNTAGTWEFRAEVKSGVCSSVYSNSKYIIVYAQANGGNLSGNNTICLGNSTGTLNLSSYSGTISKWIRKVNNGAWQDIANTNSTFSETPNQAGVWQYQVLVTNGPCSTANSNIITIIVDPISQGGSISGLSNICQGSSTGSLSLTGYNGNIITWQRRFNSGSWVDITINSSSYSEVLYTPGYYEYRVEVKSGNCSSTYSSLKSITVAQNTIPGSVIGGSSICQGDYTNSLTLVGNIGSVLKWEKMLNNGNWQPIFNTSNTFSEIPSQPGIWYYRALVQNGNCSSNYSSATLVSVDSSTKGGLINGINSICIGSNSDKLKLINYRGNIIKWQKSNNSSAWYDIATNSNFFIDTPSQSGYWKYRVEVKNGACPSSYSQIKNLQVDALSQGGVTIATPGICIGNNTGYISLKNEVGTQIIWYKRSPSSQNWNLIGNADSIIDTPTLVGSNLYRAQVKNGVCPADYSMITNVTVFDKTISGYLSSSNSSLCIGSSSMIQLTGQTGAVSIWQKRINSGIWSDINSFSTLYSEKLTSNGLFEFRALVQNGSCQSQFTTPIQISVSDSTDGGILVGESEICFGDKTNNLTLIGSKGKILEWDRKINNKPWEKISYTGYFYNEIPVDTGIILFRTYLENGVCPPKYSKEAKVIVRPIPKVKTGNDKSICLGNSVNLIATGAEKYYWNNGGFGSSIEVSPNITSYYIVQGINNYKCYDYDTIQVVVNSLPVADFKAGEICLKDTFNFINKSINSKSFSWDFGDTTAISSDHNPKHVYKASGNYFAKLIAYTSESCSDTIFKEISVMELPNAKIIGKEEVCKNESWVRYSADNDYNEFLWSVDGGKILDYRKNAIDVNWLNGNFGKIYLVENDFYSGCSKTDSLQINISKYTALDAPLLVAKADNINTNILLIPFANYNYYKWGYKFKYFQNSDVIVATGNPYCEYKFIDTINFYYWVDVTNDGHCITRSYFNKPNYFVSNDDKNISGMNQITFNNPVTEGVLYLQILSSPRKIIYISLLSMEGKELYNNRIINEKVNAINISHLRKGIYLMMIASEKGMRTYKVILN